MGLKDEETRIDAVDWGHEPARVHEPDRAEMFRRQTIGNWAVERPDIVPEQGRDLSWLYTDTYGQVFRLRATLDRNMPLEITLVERQVKRDRPMLTVEELAPIDPRD